MCLFLVLIALAVHVVQHVAALAGVHAPVGNPSQQININMANAPPVPPAPPAQAAQNNVVNNPYFGNVPVSQVLVLSCHALYSL